MTLRVHPDQLVAESASPLLQIAPWWERARLGDLAGVVNGAAFPSKQFNNEGKGLPLVRIRDVGKEVAQVHFEGPFDERHRISHGDLLIGMDGDFRIASWAGGEALLNQRVCKLEPDPAVINTRFLLHCVQPYLNAVRDVTSAITVKHLSSKTVAELPVPLPPRAEQERIVAAIEEHFSRLDAADAQLAGALARLTALSRSILERAFRDETTSAPLGTVARIGSGATPARTKVYYWEGGSIPWVASGALNDSIITSPSGFITQAALAETSVKLWPAGTVLVAMYGEGKTRGRASILGFEATCNQACAAIVPDQSQLRSEYLRWWLTSRYEANRRLASGGVQPNLSLGLVRAMAVPLPDVSTQGRIVATIEEQIGAIERLTQDIGRGRQRIASLRRSFLAAAFAGKLVPQDPDDEPAAVLLERIRAERG